MDREIALHFLVNELTRKGKILSFTQRMKASDLLLRLKSEDMRSVNDLILDVLYEKDMSPVGKLLRTRGRKRWEMPGSSTSTGVNPHLRVEDGQFQLSLNSYPPDRFKALDLGMRLNPISKVAVAPASCFMLSLLKRKLRPVLDESILRWEEEIRSITIPAAIDRSERLLEHQKLGVGFLTSRSRAMLIFSPGLGKTLIAISAAKYLQLERILVIAPLTLLTVWEEEVKKWLPGTPVHRIDGDIQGKTGWFLVNPEALNSSRVMERIKNHSWQAMILDESILYKNRRTTRSMNVAQIAKMIPVVWALTGSPVTKYLDDFFRPLQLLEPEKFSSYWRFADYYCIKQDSPWGTKIVGNKSGAEDLLRHDLEDICLFQHLDQIQEFSVPDWERQTVQVKLGKTHSQLYRNLKKDLRMSLPEGGELTVANKLELTLRLLQMATSPELLGGEHQSGKVDALVELIEQNWPEQAIVWVNFRRTGQWLEKELLKREFQPALINGDTTPQRRQQIREQFQAGDIKILIMNLQTGKFGLSFPSVPMYYLERTYDRDAFVQSMYRNRRLTTKEVPRITVLQAVLNDGKPTVDHLIHQLLEENLQLTTELLRGHLEE